MVVKSHRKSAWERPAGGEKRADWRGRSVRAASSAGTALPAVRIAREKRTATTAGSFQPRCGRWRGVRPGGRFEAFTPVELLVELDGGFLHQAVGFLAAAEQEEVLPRVRRVCPSSWSNASPSRAADLRASWAALTA